MIRLLNLTLLLSLTIIISTVTNGVDAYKSNQQQQQQQSIVTNSLRSSDSLYIYAFGLSGNNNYNISIIDVENGETLKYFIIPAYDILGIANDDENNLIILGQQDNGTYILSKLDQGSDVLTTLSSMTALPRSFTYVTSSYAYYPNLGNTAALLGLFGKEKVALVQFNFTDSTLKLVYFNITQAGNPIASGSGDNYYVQYQSADSDQQMLLVYSISQHQVVSNYIIEQMPSFFVQLFCLDVNNVYGLIAQPGSLSIYHMNLTNKASGSSITATMLIGLQDIHWNVYMSFLLNNEQYLTIFTYPTKKQLVLTTFDLSTQTTIATLNSTNVDWNNSPLSYLIVEKQ